MKPVLIRTSVRGYDPQWDRWVEMKALGEVWTRLDSCLDSDLAPVSYLPPLTFLKHPQNSSLPVDSMSQGYLSTNSRRCGGCWRGRDQYNPILKLADRPELMCTGISKILSCLFWFLWQPKCKKTVCHIPRKSPCRWPFDLIKVQKVLQIIFWKLLSKHGVY